jgi:hypothetical protein
VSVPVFLFLAACGAHAPLDPDRSRAVDIHVTNIPQDPDKPVLIIQVAIAVGATREVRCPKPRREQNELHVYLEPLAEDGPATVQALAFDTFFDSSCGGGPRQNEPFPFNTPSRASGSATGDVVEGKLVLELPLTTSSP